MGEEVLKLLGPWPVLQFFFGVGILGFGVFMIVRGLQKADKPVQLEDRRAEWQAYEHLRNIEENSFKQTELLRRILEELQRITGILWNRDKL